ncbi:hypothetical protein CTI12_AA444650 [Artemisia annua]|uniref:Uncharacterized protein n=1 Tax=Artemisia annua TaxID=35608 RepID=A0A2U1LWT3_ARTAN|nr:hypothetical protein CTI12_AA444650 [Artemisia annua]
MGHTKEKVAINSGSMLKFVVEILVGNLCTVWIGSHRLHANVARFSRPVVNSSKSNGHTTEKVRINSVRVNSSSVSRNKHSDYAQAVKGQAQIDVDSHPVLVLDESCVNQKEFSHCLNGKVKEFGSLTNLKMVLCNEGFNDVDIRYLGGLWVMFVFKSIDVKEKFSECVAINSWFSCIVQSNSDFVVDGRVAWVDVEGVPLKMWTSNTFKKIGAKWGTLLDVEESDEDNYHSKRLCIHTVGVSNVFESFKISYKGKVYWVRAKEVSGWIPNFEETSEDASESYNSLSDDGFHGDIGGGDEVNQDEDDVSMVPDSMADKVVSNDVEGLELNDDKEKSSADPFGIYTLLRKNGKKDTNESSNKESLKFPPGFTPREEGECDNGASDSNKHLEVNSRPKLKKTKISGRESVDFHTMFFT